MPRPRKKKNNKYCNGNQKHAAVDLETKIIWGLGMNKEECMEDAKHFAQEFKFNPEALEYIRISRNAFAAVEEHGGSFSDWEIKRNGQINLIEDQDADT